MLDVEKLDEIEYQIGWVLASLPHRFRKGVTRAFAVRGGEAVLRQESFRYGK
jgi:hypothetical protein